MEQFMNETMNEQWCNERCNERCNEWCHTWYMPATVQIALCKGVRTLPHTSTLCRLPSSYARLVSCSTIRNENVISAWKNTPGKKQTPPSRREA